MPADETDGVIYLFGPPLGQDADDECAACGSRLAGQIEKERGVCDDCALIYER